MFEFDVEESLSEVVNNLEESAPTVEAEERQ
jgi:hypothetical protein